MTFSVLNPYNEKKKNLLKEYGLKDMPSDVKAKYDDLERKSRKFTERKIKEAKKEMNKILKERRSRRRPGQHVRVVRTKTGRKRVVVNRGIPKKRYVTSKGTFKKMTNPMKPRIGKKSKFHGCTRSMMARGYNLDASQRICGKIKYAKKRG